jgi:hypothetical protein
MMIAKIRRFSILQTGKMLAVLYGFFSIIILPIFFIMLLVKPVEAIPLLIMAILYPVMGFIGGIIGAALYNLASRFMGGLELTLDFEQDQQNP